MNQYPFDEGHKTGEEDAAQHLLLIYLKLLRDLEVNNILFGAEEKRNIG